jgi:hypothetical protein
MAEDLDGDNIGPIEIEHRCDEIFEGEALQERYNYIVYHFDCNGSYFWARTYTDNIGTVSVSGPYDREKKNLISGPLDEAMLSYFKRRFNTVVWRNERHVVRRRDRDGPQAELQSFANSVEPGIYIAEDLDGDNIRPIEIEHKYDEFFEYDESFEGEALRERYNYIVYRFDCNGSYFSARAYIDDGFHTVSVFGPYDREKKNLISGPLDEAMLSYFKRRFRKITKLGGPSGGYTVVWSRERQADDRAYDRALGRAQAQLGLFFATGKGVPQDYAAAESWWRKAAEHGDGDSQCSLGVIYHEGKGVPKDYAAAASWFRKAAEQGHASAQLNLGKMSAMGQGVPQDYVIAHMWFNLAAARGHKNAVKVRDMVAARMTPAQIAEAQKLAREWKPK